MTYRRLCPWVLFSCLTVLPLAKMSVGSGRSGSLCGPLCLLAACQKLDVQARLEELTRLCGYDEKGGTTMLGLQNAAKAKGLHAVGTKVGVDELAGLRCPAIAHLWDNHFVVVEAGDADTIRVTDPPAEPQAVKKEDFKKLYSGFALLVAKDAALFPKPESNGPDVRFDGYAWDFGTANEGETAGHTFKCRNVGNADLVVSKVETSCGDCLVPTNGPQRLPPGYEGEIKAVLTTAGRRRGLAHTLFVSSNDPISPVVHLAATGYVRPGALLFSPRSVYFGKPRRTETVSREILIPSYEEDKIEITSVSSDSAFVVTEVSPSKLKDLPGYVVTATLKPGPSTGLRTSAPIGELKGTITINSNHWKQPRAEVSFTATIRGDIDLDRDSFFFGLVKKGAEKKTTLTVSTVGPSTELRNPLKIDKIDCSLSYVSVDIAPKTEGKEYLLTATLKPDAPLGNIRGEITIHTNNADRPRITVPVYAYVEEK